MTSTVKARDLKAKDWFRDPHREDRLPAMVVKVICERDGKVHLELDDLTRWAPWTASYQLNEELELLV